MPDEREHIVESESTGHSESPPALESVRLRELDSSRRLETLETTGELDSAAEEAFDRLTGLAVNHLGVAVSLVSLVTTERQFFKSCIFDDGVGLEERIEGRSTPLSHSLCQYVTAGEPLIVEDTGQHETLKDHCAVVDLGVAAYAGFPVRALNGSVLGALCAISTKPRGWTPEELSFLEDLAACASTEFQLRESLAEQTRLLESKDRLLGTRNRESASAVHDLRGPLQGAMLTATLLERHVGSSPEIENLQQSLRSLASLIDDLQGARPQNEPGESPPNSHLRVGSPVSLREPGAPSSVEQVIRAALRQTSAQARKQSVQLEWRPRARDVLLVADYHQAVRALWNLVANAIQHSPPGASVRINDVDSAPGRLRMVVDDQGPGVDATHHDEVFQPFWSTRLSSGGSGLGLSIVREMMSANGGQCGVDQNSDGGARFWLEFLTVNQVGSED